MTVYSLYSFPNFESVSCCFLTCMQVSQETGRVAWSSHLYRNFPQFFVIHSVKGYSVVSEAEMYVFLEFLCFLLDPMIVDNLISGYSASLKPSLYTWNFMVYILLKPRFKDFEHTLQAREMSAIIW